MSDNLRIIYKNWADTGVLTTSVVGSASTTINNARNNYRSIPYRSPTVASGGMEVMIKLDLGVPQSIDSVVLALTNLSHAATIRVFGSTTDLTIGGTIVTGTVSGTILYDSGNILCMPYVEPGKTYWGNNTRALEPYNTDGYARVFLPTSPTYRYWVVRIADTFTNNPAGYIQFSRLIMGKYWSPVYNTSYSGLSLTDTKVGTVVRTEAGDLVGNTKHSYSSISIPIKYMLATDRAELLKLIKTTDYVYASVFVGNDEGLDKEKTYQIYGKVANSTQITHPLFSIYSSKLDIESI